MRTGRPQWVPIRLFRRSRHLDFCPAGHRQCPVFESYFCSHGGQDGAPLVAHLCGPGRPIGGDADGAACGQRSGEERSCI